MFKRLLPFLLLLTPLAWPQVVVSTTITQDITSYCTSGTDCFVPLPSADCSHGIRVAGGGQEIYCLNASGTILDLPITASSWTTTSWTGEYGLAVQSPTQIYVLRPDTTHCVSPNYGVYSLNTTNGTYTFANACGTIVNAASDGTLVEVNSSSQAWGGIYYTNNPANGWTQLPLSNVWGWVAVANSHLVVGVKTNHTVWQCDPTNCAWAQLGTLSNAIDVAVSFSGDVSVIGSDNLLHHWNGSAWASASGASVSAVAEQSVGMIFAGIGGEPYHWNIIGGGSQSHLSGNVNGCPPPNVCTPGTEHTGHVQAVVPSGLAGSLATGETSPQNNENLTSTDFSGQCDFTFQGPSDPKCKPTEMGSIFCPIAGAYLFTDAVHQITPCSVPFSARNGWWPANKAITVYFDGNYFTQGSSCPNTANALCNLYRGMQNWNNTTTNKNTVTLGGVLTPAQICPTIFGPAPCASANPVYPWIMVTDATAMNNAIPGFCVAEGCSNGPINNTDANSKLVQTGQIGIATVGFYQSHAAEYENVLNYLGAHEFGHTFGLDNCDGDSHCVQLGGAPQTPGTTVMWYQAPVPPSVNITGPSECDQAWANIAQKKYGK